MAATNSTAHSDVTEQPGHPPLHMDGWNLIHNALRRNMKDFRGALAIAAQEKSGGEDLSLEHSRKLSQWWGFFVSFMESHHDHEETIFFPELCKRVQLPPKLTHDHVHLKEHLHQLHATMQAALGAQTAAERREKLCEALESFDRLRADIEEHFTEEEEEALPLLRQHFTGAEVKKLTARALKEGHPLEVGGFLRPMSLQQKLEWSKLEGVPAAVMWLVILPRCRQYENTYTQLLLDIDPSVSLSDAGQPLSVTQMCKDALQNAQAQWQHTVSRFNATSTSR